MIRLWKINRNPVLGFALLLACFIGNAYAGQSPGSPPDMKLSLYANAGLEAFSLVYLDTQMKSTGFQLGQNPVNLGAGFTLSVSRWVSFGAEFNFANAVQKNDQGTVKLSVLNAPVFMDLDLLSSKAFRAGLMVGISFGSVEAEFFEKNLLAAQFQNGVEAFFTGATHQVGTQCCSSWAVVLTPSRLASPPSMIPARM
jgi:hypothetical protein